MTVSTVCRWRNCFYKQILHTVTVSRLSGFYIVKNMCRIISLLFVNFAFWIVQMTKIRQKFHAILYVILLGPVRVPWPWDRCRRYSTWIVVSGWLYLDAATWSRFWGTSGGSYTVLTGYTRTPVPEWSKVPWVVVTCWVYLMVMDWGSLCGGWRLGWVYLAGAGVKSGIPWAVASGSAYLERR